MSWRMVTLRDVVELQRGYDLPEQERRAGPFAIVGSAGPNGLHERANVQGPGVVIGRSGAGFGSAHYCETDFWALNTGLFVKDFLGNHPKFIYYLLDYLDFSKYNSGGAQPSLNRNFIYPISVQLPCRDEQERIARVLTAWESTIQKTEQLIAAKERSSKALMQRVFRMGPYPRHRLSQFAHRVTRKNREGNGHPLTISGAGGLVSQSSYFGKRIAAEKTEHYTLLKRGEYAYNKSYSAGYPLGAIKRLDAHEAGIVSTLYLCFALDVSKAPISDYFAFFCEAGGFNHQIYQVAQEGARNHGLLNVTADDFFSMTMPMPPRDVQERVVNVLGTAMRELSLLRAQLAAARNQKRGLMQKLLSGQWRLPVPDDVEEATNA